MGGAYLKRAELEIEGGGDRRGALGKDFHEFSNSTDSEMHRFCH